MATSGKSIARAFLKRILLLYAINFLISCNQDKAKVPYYNSPDFTPSWINDKKIIDTFHRIGPFSFTDQFGKSITQKTFEGKIYVADFFFTRCPGICPRMATNMKLVYDHYKNNPGVLFISHSVTPERDSVPLLKKYAESRGINNDQWHFVTGNKNDIYTLARKSYFVEQMIGFAKDSSEFLHTENFILIDKHSHIRGIFNGTLAVEADRIIADIDELLKEN